MEPQSSGNLSDLEEVRSLCWVLQEALDKCNKGGLRCFHLWIPVLTQTELRSTRG